MQEKTITSPEAATKKQLPVVAKNVINLYEKPDTSSELVSQAIYGSRLEVQKEEEDFVYVMGEDRYCGFTDKRHLAADFTQNGSVAVIRVFFAEVYSQANRNSELITKLVLGTEVSILKNSSNQSDFLHIELPGNKRGWIAKESIEGSIPVVTQKAWESADKDARAELISDLGQEVVANAEAFIGTPYLWGGCTPFGIDCSGLTQIAYKQAGLQLFRDADLQYNDMRFTEIEKDKPFDQALFQAGDLVFFGKNISHIGIALGDGRFIHASGRQANFGTYINSCQKDEWKAIYMGAKRLSESALFPIENA